VLLASRPTPQRSALESLPSETFGILAARAKFLCVLRHEVSQRYT
jgi:hypothetical protein